MRRTITATSPSSAMLLDRVPDDGDRSSTMRSRRSTAATERDPCGRAFRELIAPLRVPIRSLSAIRKGRRMRLSGGDP